MIGVELFSGAGGMSLGASMAGIKTKFAVEIDRYAAQTFMYNHRNTFMFNDDIRNLQSIPIENVEGPKILFGGPPCQGFSLSNQKNRNKENEKNWLFKEFVRITNFWKPDWFVLENVSGILTTEKGYIFEEILKEFQLIGYNTSYKLLNSVDFGIPQRRSRVFIVGSLHGISFKFPDPINEKPITVDDAIHDLPSIQNGRVYEELAYKCSSKTAYAKALRGNSKFSTNNNVTKNSALVIERYKHIPQGGNWQNIPLQLMANYKDCSRCHTGIYHRLHPGKPSVVIGNFRKNMLIHPTDDRGLSVREAARLQSFPDSFKFLGSVGFTQQQVGNSVPPLLAKAVFEELLKY